MGQKLDFADFVADWLDKHEVYDPQQVKDVTTAAWACGWHWFTEELIEYYRLVNDIYQLNDDGTVTVFEG